MSDSRSIHTVPIHLLTRAIHLSYIPSNLPTNLPTYLPTYQLYHRYKKIADKYKVSLVELSLLWARQREYVTTSLVGCSSTKQLEQDLKVYKDSCRYSQGAGLPESAMWEIDRVHMRNRNPIFASTRAGIDWNNEGEIGERIP